MTLIQRIGGLHSSATAALRYLQSPLLLAIRLSWGWQFAEDGWGKLHNLDKVTNFFTSLNLPQPHMTALFVSLIELVGGVLLGLGIFTRLTALVLFVNMTVAYLTAEPDAFKAIFTDPDKFSSATSYNYWFVSLILLIFGPGYLALDTIFGRFFAPQRVKPALS